MIGPAMRDTDPSSVPGRTLIKASWAGTVAFAITSTMSVLAESLRPIGVVTALVWFGAGCIAFLWAWMIGLERSRSEELAVTGIYFLAGSAPAAVRVSLLGSVLVQLAIAFAAASLRPFTSVAFGILVPMYGLGVAGLWGSRHGTYPPRRDPRSDQQRTKRP
jgi:hypothetical protein